MTEQQDTRKLGFSNPLGRLLHIASEKLEPPIGMIELTFACNLDCEFCYNSKVLNQLTFAELCDVMDQMKALGVFKLTFTGGEALVRKDFFELAAYAQKIGLGLVLYSNVVLLAREELADRVAALNLSVVETSLHGASAETFDKLTKVPGSFDKFVKALRNMKARGIRSVLKATVTQYNQHEVRAMKAFADEIGYPVTFDVHITPTDTGGTEPMALKAADEVIQWLYKESGYTMASEPLHRAPGFTFCGVATKAVCLDPFGNVLPCLNYRKVMGNIRQQSLHDIWHNSPVGHEIRAINKAIVERIQSEHGDLADFCEYCPGAAELESGDPFKVPEIQLLKARTKQDLHQVRLGGGLRAGS